jgi:hypothetical protein
LDSEPSAVKNKKTYHECGKIIAIDKWVVNGELHREDGPALKKYSHNGTLIVQNWAIDGFLHRETHPASIWYYDAGTIERMRWFKQGVLHRKKGPADIRFKKNGEITSETWAINGLVAKRAEIVDNEELITYYKNRRIHREDGPAIIHGDIKRWFLGGKEYPDPTKIKTEKDILDYIKENGIKTVCFFKESLSKQVYGNIKAGCNLL